jgi:methionyl-tRNA formyltransferase
LAWPASVAFMARLVYLGTPEAAVPPLRTLVAAGHDVALVVTRPDKRRGRGSQLVPSPVKAAALDLDLAVTDDLASATGVGAELGVVVAYGRIVPAAVLDELPMVNLHFSLLPRWRGAAPVERAILEGDAETGVCLMAVEAGLDTGAVYAEEATAIDPEETATELRARLVIIGCRMLEDHLAAGRVGLPVPRDQAGNGRAPPSSSPRWFGSAGPGRHSGASASGCWPPIPPRRLQAPFGPPATLL